MRYRFDWDPTKEAKNICKHKMSFRRAATVFRDPDQVSIYDQDHSKEKDRWITIGLDSTGILRVVIHTFDELTKDLVEIRIISARKATKMEIKQYRGMNV